jgi:hypothetical protein
MEVVINKAHLYKLIASAAEAKQVPRVHGNGFIQLDVHDTLRLHFWGHPEIPRAVPTTPIHDHVFSFTSEVVMGSIMNINYTIKDNPHGLYAVYKASPVKLGENGWGIEPTGEVCDLVHLDHIVYRAGARYFMPKDVLHETNFQEWAVTAVFKHGPTLAQNPDGAKPRIMVPRCTPLNNYNGFDRNSHEPNKLWGIIEEIVSHQLYGGLTP